MSESSGRVLLVNEMVARLRSGALDAFAARASELEAADLADVLSALDEDERVIAVQTLPPEVSSQALIEMPEEEHAGETLAALEPERAAEILEELADDDAADILGELEPSEQERILAEVEDAERADVEKLLVYDAESAGGLMTTRIVTVPDTSTVAEALDEIRRQSEEIEDFYEVFVTDTRRNLVGVLPFKAVAINPPAREVREVMEPADIRVGPEEDQENVARLMARYNLASIPVTDEGGRLLGAVTFDDVTDVVEAETTEDILKFGGVSPSEELGGTWQSAVRSRLPWLAVNLVTASAGATVVHTFSSAIQTLGWLAVFMPVVAGMGGNTGTQALAVTVRRLALGQVALGQRASIVGKELLVGAINGSAIAAVVATVGWLAVGPQFGLVVFAAMIGNLAVAGFAGAFVPLLLEKLGVDPAIASSIFVTAFTDMCGFFLLLGLAANFLL